MKAGTFSTLWRIIASYLATADICIRTVIKSYLGPLKREWVAQLLQRWTKRILALPKAQITINRSSFNIEQGQAYIIMCNHTSIYDIPLSFHAFPQHHIRMLAKKELSYIPIFSHAMRAAEFPFIDRKNREQAIHDLDAAKKLMEEGIFLWIAPEGTRSKTGALGPFKKGGFITAIQTKAKIIPVGICNAHKILPKGKLKFNLNQQVEINIGKPVDSAEYPLENKDALIEHVHKTIAKLTKHNEPQHHLNQVTTFKKQPFSTSVKIAIALFIISSILYNKVLWL